MKERASKLAYQLLCLGHVLSPFPVYQPDSLELAAQGMQRAVLRRFPKANGPSFPSPQQNRGAAKARRAQAASYPVPLLPDRRSGLPDLFRL
jgi:hypothetical protein